MLTLQSRRPPAQTIAGLQAHQQNMRAANDEPLPTPRPFYRPEITLGEAAFMAIAGTAIVAVMHGLAALIRFAQAWMGAA